MAQTTPFRIRCRSLAAAAVAGLAVAACGGTIEADIYEPVRVGKSELSDHGRHAATIDLGDAQLVLFPLDVSRERTSMIYGPFLILPTFEEKVLIDAPLRINIQLEILRNTLTVDLSRAAIAVGGRTLYPVSVGDRTGVKVVGPLQLTRQPFAQVFELRYEIRTTELKPFTLQIPEIQLNERNVAVRRVTYRRGSRESPG